MKKLLIVLLMLLCCCTTVIRNDDFGIRKISKNKIRVEHSTSLSGFFIIFKYTNGDTLKLKVIISYFGYIEKDLNIDKNIKYIKIGENIFCMDSIMRIKCIEGDLVYLKNLNKKLIYKKENHKFIERKI